MTINHCCVCIFLLFVLYIDVSVIVLKLVQFLVFYFRAHGYNSKKLIDGGSEIRMIDIDLNAFQFQVLSGLVTSLSLLIVSFLALMIFSSCSFTGLSYGAVLSLQQLETFSIRRITCA
jgi:hypothetical protein